MKRFIAAGIICLMAATAALAQSPLGLWRVEEGSADIRIAQCGPALWGVIAWTKGPQTDTDANNPDPALRSRPVIGMPILINMQQSGAKWEGEVYNAENGKTYSSNISLVSPDVLRIEGCVLGFLCGGENWTRVPLPKGAPSDPAVCSKLPK